MHGEDVTFLSLLLIVWAPRMMFGFGGCRHDLVAFLIFLSLSNVSPKYIIAFVPILLVILVIARAVPLQGLEPGSQYSAPHRPDGDLQRAFKPLILPCQTSHSRTFPRKHNFSYSYLQVGVPVGWRGCIASMVATDLDFLPGTRPFPWDGIFKVAAADHLHRSTERVGLRAKLDTYIESQYGDPADYPFAYLVTAPRFLGYCFNPVSFWYLYNKQNRLGAMILEVNNTFDERRMYFLVHKHSEEAPGALNKLDDHGLRFKYSWPKDFHVSPFNSRKGSYSLSASDPFPISGEVLVDNTITLKSSKDHPKIVARLFSTAPAVDPSSMTVWQKLRFVMSWWWVGFLTYPRIVKEAGKLYFHKKLHVWFRPEVAHTSIGRRETGHERTIEACFRQYLSHQVSEVPLLYVSPRLGNVHMGNSPHGFRADAMDRPTPTLQVLTPLFYAQLALRPDPASLVTSILARSDSDRTVHVELPKDVVNILGRIANQPFRGLSTWPVTWPDRIRWWILGTLCPCRSSRPLDDFMRAEATAVQAARYLQAATFLRASHWLAFGVPELLDFGAWVCRSSLCWLSARNVAPALQRWDTGEESEGYEAPWWRLSLVVAHVWLVIEGAMVERRQH